jgi:pimeloyl-ACP methyl ester carboxylesterase
MRIFKLFFKWLLISLIFIFIAFSSIPYFFSENKSITIIKPFSNSYFFTYNNTTFHYRLFIPNKIKSQTCLIHGFGASSFSFRKNIDSLLSINSLVVTMDVPGLGFSDKSSRANYTDTNKINSIHLLLTEITKKTKIEKWNLIGHSMGSITIGQFASKYPAETNALIFIDGLPFHQKHSIFQSGTLYPPLLKWADFILEKQLLNIQTFQNLISSAYNQPADSLSALGYLKPFKISNSGSAIFRMANGMGYANINDSIIYSLPKLVIWGKQDQWIPLSLANDFIKKPNTTSLILDNSGHCPMETHPNEVNNTITNFISNLN